MLNEYYTVLTEATYRQEGTIFNMAGDSLLVGFNVPFLQADAAERAWRTAEDMLTNFGKLAAAWRARHGISLMGEVLVSGDFYDAIRPLVPANRVESRGAVALRGKSEMVRVYAIRP